MTVHQKINTKGNLQTWLGPNSFRRAVVKCLKLGYRDEEGRRFYYQQDRKTNYTEPREADGEDFRGNEAAIYERDEMARIQREEK